jgi:hypothetical protein
MLRLFFTAVVCALTLLPAGSQNKVSETLLGLGEEERNEAFTGRLKREIERVDHRHGAS